METEKKPRRARKKETECEYVDYKDVPSLRRYMSAHGKIHSRKRTKTCGRCQRAIARAVKRARFMGILSYTN